MTEEQALRHVYAAVATVCRTDIAQLRPNTRPNDVKGWDSFGRLQVVLEIERISLVELPVEQAFEAQTVSALAGLLRRQSL